MRSGRPSPLAALFLALFTVAGIAPAFSHAAMTASVPKDGATVAAGVSEIEMDFSRAVRLTVVGVVRVEDHKAIGLVGALPGTFGKSAIVKVEPLTAGSYQVSWTCVSADGHVMNGGFAFLVGDGTAPPKPAP